MKHPTIMTVCSLQVLLMPNGEIICEGKTLGWFDRMSKYLKPEEKGEKA